MSLQAHPARDHCLMVMVGFNFHLTLNGGDTGYGILVVTGTLTMSGNFTWYGSGWPI